MHMRIFREGNAWDVYVSIFVHMKSNVHYYPYIMHLRIILLFYMKSIVLKDERERKKKTCYQSADNLYFGDNHSHRTVKI
jgi:hypothetical protein